jgi:predicted GIY-YIG superfamily endonuclease
MIIYVYIFQSLAGPEHFYVGIAKDLKSRLKEHNASEVFHTSKYKPWKIKNYFAFENHEKAFAFERYLKTASGRAFAKKHF